MNNVYIIIGDGACGKSSIVRALTGIYRTATRYVRQINNTDLLMRIWPQSAQEAGKDPSTVLNEINNANASNVLITLRYSPAPNMIQFNAVDYYNLLIQHHNVVQVVFMTGGQTIKQFNTNCPSNNIVLSTRNPVNANANKVRNWWGWL